MMDNGILENRPSNQGLDSFFILNLNIPISPIQPQFSYQNQVNFSVEIPEICKQIDKTPELIDYKDLYAQFVTMKNEIYMLKLEIKSLKEGIEITNSKQSPDKNYNQEFFFRTTKLFFKTRNYIKTEYY